MHSGIGSHAFHQSFNSRLLQLHKIFDADYFLFASQGAFILEVGSRRWLLPPQRGALIAAHTEITISTFGPTTASSVLFRDGELGANPPACRVFAVSDLARGMVDHAMQWEKPTSVTDSAANYFFHALASVLQQLAAVEQETWLPKARSPALARATDYTLAHLDSNLGFAKLAAAAHLSERTLARRFKDELGMTWKDYQRRARMIRAMETLLSGDESVTKVALSCGFESTTSFIRAFRDFSGVTPRKYRQSFTRKS